MKFQAAYAYMKHRGWCIKLPEFGGYWYWDTIEQTIRIRTRYGDDLDLRTTPQLAYTIEFLFRDDWELDGRLEDKE